MKPRTTREELGKSIRTFEVLSPASDPDERHIDEVHENACRDALSLHKIIEGVESIKCPFSGMHQSHAFESAVNKIKSLITKALEE